MNFLNCIKYFLTFLIVFPLGTSPFILAQDILKGRLWEVRDPSLYLIKEYPFSDPENLVPGRVKSATYEIEALLEGDNKVLNILENEVLAKFPKLQLGFKEFSLDLSASKPLVKTGFLHKARMLLSPVLGIPKSKVKIEKEINSTKEELRSRISFPINLKIESSYKPIIEGVLKQNITLTNLTPLKVKIDYTFKAEVDSLEVNYGNEIFEFKETPQVLEETKDKKQVKGNSYRLEFTIPETSNPGVFNWSQVANLDHKVWIQKVSGKKYIFLKVSLDLEPNQSYTIDPIIGVAKEEVEKRTEFSKTFNNGDGTFTTEFVAGPIHYKDKDGQWKDIQTSIKLAPLDSEFDYQNLENTYQSFFKAKPLGYFAKLQKEGKYILISLDGTGSFDPNFLKNSQTIIDKNTITYLNIAPDLDLKMKVLEGMFLEEFILKDKRSIDKYLKIPQLIKTSGALYEVKDTGEIIFKDKRGNFLWTFPAPKVYELNNPLNVNYGIKYEIKDLGNGEFILVKSLTSEGIKWLQDSQRRYPVVIDATSDFIGETIDGYIRRYSDAGICGGNTYIINTSNTGIQFGSDLYLAPGISDADLIRGYISFNTGSTIPSSSVVTGATLYVYISDAMTSGGNLNFYQKINCWGTSLDSSDWGACGTTIDGSVNVSTTGRRYTSVNTSEVAKGSGRTQFEGRGSDESCPSSGDYIGWFTGADYGSGSACTTTSQARPCLRVTYNYPPSPPTSLAQYQSDCSTPLVGTCPGANCYARDSVCMSGYIDDPDPSDQVKLQVDLNRDGTVDNTSSSYCTDPCTNTVVLSGLTDGTSYTWRARAIDDDNSVSTYTDFNSGNTAFTVDLSPPSVSAGPSDGGSSATNPTNAGDPVTFTVTATDSGVGNYKLLVCKTAGLSGDACDGGASDTWCDSKTQSGNYTPSGSQASCSYTTSDTDAESNDWYAYVCDELGNCSSALQGTGDTGSPFNVNHRPKYSWYDPNWQYRKQITFTSDTNKIPSSGLTNFPVLISITDPDLSSKAQTNGNDILFTDSDGITKLDHEIESYDSSTGKLEAWVRIPTLTPGKTIYMYYGNPSATNQQNPTAVWDSNFVMVQHLQETGTAIRQDSTSNNNDGTPYNGVSDSQGIIDGADSFDGVDDYIKVTNNSSLNPAQITVELFVKLDVHNDGNIRYIIEKWAGGWGPGWYIRDRGNGNFQAVYYNGSTYTALLQAPTAVNQWIYLATTHTGSEAKLYKNGVLQDSDLTTTLDNDVSDLYIGARDGISELLDGTIDEVRISNIARSPEWIKASYETMANPSTFFSLGKEQTQSTSVSASPEVVSVGDTITFKALASDSDIVPTSDTVSLYVCKANDFTGTACGAEGTWCYITGQASDPSCSYTVSITDPPGVNNYYAFLIDNHNFQASNNPQTGSFEINPAFSLSISQNSLDFGSFSNTQVRWATGGANSGGSTTEPAVAPTTLTISTNAPNGAVVYAQSQGDGSSAGLYKSSPPPYLIPAVASSAVSSGSEGYGLYVKNATGGLTIDEGFDDDGVSDKALSTTSQLILSATGALDSATADIFLKASISVSTVAGEYQDIITITATGKF